MRLSLLFSLLVILTLGLVSPAFAGPTMGDHDLDGIDSLFDNCRDASNTNQRDPDGDGCGAVCDGDYDQDGVVAGTDFLIFRASFLAGTPLGAGYNENADHSGDGIVAGNDFLIFRAQFGAGVPGPSKAAYRNLTACP